MENCKDEFLRETKDKDILCATITHCKDYDDDKSTALLNVGFGDFEFNLFLHMIDYKYDDGYGGQEVYGTIWYKDGTWSERGEYDGSEWWEHKSCPEIPKELQNV
jgi:hypothetical protein